MLLSGEHELKSSFVGAMDLKDLHVPYKVGMFSGIQCENLQVALQETDWGGVTCGSSEMESSRGAGQDCFETIPGSRGSLPS